MKLPAELQISLGQIYVWLDIIFFALAGVMILFWYVIHLSGNILTGRFKNRFILKKWPAHEGEVRPIERYMHLIHVIGMVLLGISGLYIRFPDVIYVPGGRGLMKAIHYVCMFIITTNFIYRYYYAFLGKHRDYLKFKLTWREIKVMPLTMLYYFFIKPSKPHLAQYNPLQKMTYGYAFAGMMPLQALTGFILFFRNFWSPYVGGILGGAANIVQVTRIAHYSINWLLIIFTLIHIYLAVTENFPAFLLFFFGIEPEHHEAHEEHGVSHGEPEEHIAAAGTHEVPTAHAEAPLAAYATGQPEARVGIEQSTATTILALLNSLSRRISSLEQEIKEEKAAPGPEVVSPGTPPAPPVYPAPQAPTAPSAPPEETGFSGPAEPTGHDGSNIPTIY